MSPLPSHRAPTGLPVKRVYTPNANASRFERKLAVRRVSGKFCSRLSGRLPPKDSHNAFPFQGSKCRIEARSANRAAASAWTRHACLQRARGVSDMTAFAVRE